MEKQLHQLLDTIIADCLKAEVFLNLSSEHQERLVKDLKKHFQLTIFQTLIENLSPHQLSELNELDLSDPDSDQKIAEMSASIPNFALLLQETLLQEAEMIKKTGQIPL